MKWRAISDNHQWKHLQLRRQYFRNAEGESWRRLTTVNISEKWRKWLVKMQWEMWKLCVCEECWKKRRLAWKEKMQSSYMSRKWLPICRLQRLREAEAVSTSVSWLWLTDSWQWPGWPASQREAGLERPPASYPAVLRAARLNAVIGMFYLSGWKSERKAWCERKSH